MAAEKVFTIFVQRHGEAAHNASATALEESAKARAADANKTTDKAKVKADVNGSGKGKVEEVPLKTAAWEQIFDPSLTSKGRQQCVEVKKPELLQELLAKGATGLESSVQFWSSPLRRTVETAVASCPSALKWRLVEALRERAGQKLCDARHKKSEIVPWCQAHAPHVKEWVDEDVWSEEDELLPQPREFGEQMMKRCDEVLRLVLDQGEKTGCQNFVCISHSGFLSCFLSFTYQGARDDRWLANGEWRTIRLTPTEINTIRARWQAVFATHAGTTLPHAIALSTGQKQMQNQMQNQMTTSTGDNHQGHQNSEGHQNHQGYQNHQGHEINRGLVKILTVESAAVLALMAEPFEAASETLHPQQTMDFLIISLPFEHWPQLIESLEQAAEKLTTSPRLPLFGSKQVYFPSSDFSYDCTTTPCLNVSNYGGWSGTPILFVVHPLPPSQGPEGQLPQAPASPSLPPYVTDKLLREMQDLADQIARALVAPSATLVFLYDL